MKNLQRYNLGELARTYASDKDNVVCRAYDVDKLESQNTELLGALKSLAAAVCHLGLTEYHGSFAVTVEAARAAIAKAERTEESHA